MIIICLSVVVFKPHDPCWPGPEHFFFHYVFTWSNIIIGVTCIALKNEVKKEGKNCMTLTCVLNFRGDFWAQSWAKQWQERSKEGSSEESHSKYDSWKRCQVECSFCDNLILKLCNLGSTLICKWLSASSGKIKWILGSILLNFHKCNL